MLAQICQFLGVDSSNFPINEHIIIGDGSKYGGFLTHYFLNLVCKQSRPLCFVSFAQSFNHYSSVAQKLGTNLHSARDNKILTFVDGLGLIRDFVIEDETSLNPVSQLRNGNTAPLCNLILHSLTHVGESNSSFTNQKPPVVIIDDLSVLQSLGVPTKFLTSFLRRLISLITDYNPRLSLIVSLSIDESDIDEEEAWAYFSHIGTLTFQVSKLRSGHCKEIHGQIQVKWQDLYCGPREICSKFTQYKLLDKNIELFASGMSSAIL